MKWQVNDMTCGHCKAAIEQAVTAAGGTATVDLAARTVTVEGLDPARAEAVLTEAGYTPERL